LFIEQSRPLLKPPVSNRLLYSGEQLKVMIVGGPNARDDFHVECGEELFYQLCGGMDLDVMQEGQRTRLPINEGQLFVLPSHVPHSPQRYADTIGLVIERARLPDEQLDELRWYWPRTNRLLYTEQFYCSDLGTQIKAVIERFFAADKSKVLACRETAGAADGESESESAPRAPVEPVIHTPPPSSLADLVSSAAAGTAPTTLVDSEFVVDVYKGDASTNAAPTALRHTPGQDLFLLQLSGDCVVTAATQGPIALTTRDVCLLSGAGGAREVRLAGPGSALVAVYSKARK